MQLPSLIIWRVALISMLACFLSSSILWYGSQFDSGRYGGPPEHLHGRHASYRHYGLSPLAIGIFCRCASTWLGIWETDEPAIAWLLRSGVTQWRVVIDRSQIVRFPSICYQSIQLTSHS